MALDYIKIKKTDKEKKKSIKTDNKIKIIALVNIWKERGNTGTKQLCHRKSHWD